jgi:hypothetical protein
MLWQVEPGYISGRAALDAVVASAPVNTGLPAISGTTTVGSTLTTTNGTWSGTPTIGYAYQWKRGGTNISGATASTYLLVSADLAATVAVTVTATNTVGSTGATSTAVGPIGAPPAVARSAMLMGTIPVVVNTSTTSRDANAAGVMINSR